MHQTLKRLVVLCCLASLAATLLCACEQLNQESKKSEPVTQTRVIWDNNGKRLEHRTYYIDSDGKEVLHGHRTLWRNGNPSGRFELYDHGKLLRTGVAHMSA